MANQIYGTYDNDSLQGTDQGEYMHGFGGHDTMMGAQGNDTLLGREGDDLLQGGEGNDELDGGEGNDTVEGGPGSDTLMGWQGRDVYLFRRGSELETIQYGQSGYGSDVIRVDSGISMKELTFVWSANFITIGIIGTQDRMTFYAPIGGANYDNWDILQIELADGSVLRRDDIAVIISSPPPGYVLTASPAGGALEGFTGNDTLHAGAGNDALGGGRGRDTYVVNRGGGDDVIYETGWSYIWGVAASDPEPNVLLLPDRSPEDIVRVSGSGNHDIDIKLEFKDGGSVTLPTQLPFYISDWYTTVYTGGINEVRFGDGSTWGRDDIKSHISGDGTDASEELWGVDDRSNVLRGLGGNDALFGLSRLGNTLDGGPGDDGLQGGIGPDTYIHHRGEGADAIYDSYRWGYADGHSVPDPSHDVLLLPDYSPEDIARIVRSGGDDGMDVTLQFKDGSSVGLDTQMPSSAGWEVQSYDGGVDEVRFGDGTSWGRDDISSRVQQDGTDAADELWGLRADRPNLLQGREGNDSLHGSAFADTLDGGTGIDQLRGQEGDDVYIVDGRVDPVSGALVVDQVFEYIGTGWGIDEVITTVSDYRLPDSVENLVMNSKGWTPNGTPGLLMPGKEGTRHGTGNAQGNRMTGSASPDFFQGEGGDDMLLGLFGNDTLDGGSGLDTLAGGFGQDTYVLNDGSFTLDGQPVDVDVIVELGNDQDTVRTSIDHFQLPDLVEHLWTSATMGGGNSLDNRLVGSALPNLLMGFGGNDTLEGGGGGDTLMGGEGDDLLISASATSDDAFEWGLGQGADRLADAGGRDTLTVLPGVSREQLWLRQAGNDMEIQVIGTTDTFTIAQWYGPEGDMHRLERIELADGQALEGGRIQQLVEAMASFQPPAPGQTSLPTDMAESVHAAMAANWA